jgi:ribonuclease HI
MKSSADQEKSMGAAWLQTEEPNQGSSFIAGVTDWPSPYKAELVAIILAVLTVPQGSEVEIVTDSALCINTFNRIAKPNPKHTIRRWIKEKN